MIPQAPYSLVNTSWSDPEYRFRRKLWTLSGTVQEQKQQQSKLLGKKNSKGFKALVCMQLTSIQFSAMHMVPQELQGVLNTRNKWAAKWGLPFLGSLILGFYFGMLKIFPEMWCSHFKFLFFSPASFTDSPLTPSKHTPFFSLFASTFSVLQNFKFMWQQKEKWNKKGKWK